VRIFLFCLVAELIVVCAATWLILRRKLKAKDALIHELYASEEQLFNKLIE
jgi:hypothetical protein